MFCKTDCILQSNGWRLVGLERRDLHDRVWSGEMVGKYIWHWDAPGTPTCLFLNVWHSIALNLQSRIVNIFGLGNTSTIDSQILLFISYTLEKHLVEPR